MKRYKLKKDLPTFKAGSEFELDRGLWYKKDERGNAVISELPICAYTQQTLDKFPSILKDWFEEIPERPKTVWDLKEEDSYWYIDHDAAVRQSRWDEDATDDLRRDTGNVFLTQEDAQKELARCKAKVALERDTEGFKPDWSSERQPKLIVFYDYESGELMYESWSRLGYGVLCFPNEASVNRSIEEHPEEWLTYLGVEKSNGTK